MLGFGALGEFALGEGPSPSATIPGGLTNTPPQGRPGVAPHLHSAFFYQPFTPNIQIGWFMGLDQPYLVPKRLQPAYNPEFFFHPHPIIDISWFEALSEPQRFPPRLLTAAEPYYSAEPEPEGDELAFFQPLSEPKRFPKRLEAANNPAFTRGTAPFYQPRSQVYVIC